MNYQEEMKNEQSIRDYQRKLDHEYLPGMGHMAQ